MLTFLKLHILVFLSLFLAPVENFFHQVTVFEDLQSREIQACNILKIIPKTTKRLCAFTCSVNQQCEAFTFCKTRSCSLRSGECSANDWNTKSIGACGNYGVRRMLHNTWQTTTEEMNQATVTVASYMTQPPNNPCFPPSKGNGLNCIPFIELGLWYTLGLPMSWSDANKTCQDKNGVLLYPKTWSLTASDNLVNAQKLALGFVVEIWIGIRVNGTGDLVDVHGSLLLDVPFEDAAIPNYCIIATKGIFGLEQKPCDNSFPFTCELN